MTINGIIDLLDKLGFEQTSKLFLHYFDKEFLPRIYYVLCDELPEEYQSKKEKLIQLREKIEQRERVSPGYYRRFLERLLVDEELASKELSEVREVDRLFYFYWLAPFYRQDNGSFDGQQISFIKCIVWSLAKFWTVNHRQYVFEQLKPRLEKQVSEKQIPLAMAMLPLAYRNQEMTEFLRTLMGEWNFIKCCLQINPKDEIALDLEKKYLAKASKQFVFEEKITFDVLVDFWERSLSHECSNKIQRLVLDEAGNDLDRFLMLYQKGFVDIDLLLQEVGNEFRNVQRIFESVGSKTNSMKKTGNILDDELIKAGARLIFLAGDKEQLILTFEQIKLFRFRLGAEGVFGGLFSSWFSKALAMLNSFADWAEIFETGLTKDGDYMFGGSKYYEKEGIYFEILQVLEQKIKTDHDREKVNYYRTFKERF